MPDADKTLKIFLQFQADVAQGKAEVTGALKEIQAQAAQTAAAVRSVTITDTNVAQNPQKIVENVAFKEQQIADAARFAALRAEGAISYDLVLQQNARTVAAQAETAEQARIAAQMERRVIVETQIEAAEARLAGNPALAAKLEREADIRARALAIQRTLNITTEESIVLAEKLVLAQEASAVAANGMGVNLGKARAEALVLGRELAAGNVRASTMSSLLGSMGTTFTIAGIAAYELFHGISSAVEQSEKFKKDVDAVVKGIGDAVTETARWARESETIGDTIKISDKWTVELAQVELKMAEFRARQLGFWAGFCDSMITMFARAWNVIATKLDIGVGSNVTGPFQGLKNEEVVKAEAAAKDAYRLASEALEKSQQARNEWAKALTDPAAGMAAYGKKIEELKTKLAGIDRSSLQGEKLFNVTLHDLDDAEHKYDQLGNAQDKLNKGAKEHSGTQREITQLVREQANLLAGIRGNQQVIQSNPFLSDDQKNTLMIPLITQEIAALNAQIARDKSVLKNSALDPAQYEQVAGKIQQAGVQVTLLGQKLKTLSFAGGFRAEMVNWVNSFGTAAKQVASIITGTLNTAINATSQALTNAIFKTGSWKQAFAQAAQSIVQNLITIGIQMLASWVLSKFIKQNDASGSIAAGAQIASAYAPGAAAASIATSGGSAYSGAAAAAVAIAAIMGALLGGSGAAEGMYIDRGTTPTADDVRVRVSRGEGIINARAVAQRGGRQWVDSINSGVTRPSYASGSFVGSSAGTPSAGILRDSRPQVHFAIFDDPRKLAKWLEGRDGQKIIYDSVNRRRIDLGLPS